jgi:site-specific recombinase XerD
MSAEDYQSAVDIENISGETVPSGRHVTMAEISALLETCGQSVTDIRDAAIIGVLYAGGLRRDELIKLDYAEYEALEDDVGQLLVRGKRRKERYLPAQPATRGFLSLELGRDL